MGLDSSAFKRGAAETRVALRQTKDDANTVAKEMEADGKRAAQFFSQVKVEALGLIGILLGGKGITTFVKDATTSMAELGRQARNIGESAQAVAAFGFAMERNGGSVESAKASLKGYADAIENFRVTGQGDVPKWLSLIGANLTDAPIAAFEKFQKYVEAHKDQPGGVQLINLVGHGLGFDQGSINAAIQIGTLNNLLKELATSYGLGVPTDEQIKRAQELAKSWDELRQAADNLGNSVLSNLSPSLKAVLDDTTHLIEKNPDLVAAITAITGAFIGLRAVGSLAKALGLTELATTLSSLETIVMRLSPWLLTLSLGGDTPNADDQGREAARQAGGKAWDDWQAAHPNPVTWAWDHIKSWFTGPKLPPDVESEIRSGSAARGLDPDHMAALATREAGGYDNVSPAGAIGPMQLMPDTARGEGVDPHDWHQNIRGGLSYYQKLLKQFGGNYAVADAAYNAGPANPGVLYFARTGDPSHLPPETQKYIAAIDHITAPVTLPAPRVNVDIGSALAPPAGLRSPFPDAKGPLPDPGPRSSPLPDAKALLPDPGGRSAPASAAPAGDTVTTDVHIGTVVVNTQATDAEAMAKGVRQAITRDLTNQANRGLQ